MACGENKEMAVIAVSKAAIQAANDTMTTTVPTEMEEGGDGSIGGLGLGVVLVLFLAPASKRGDSRVRGRALGEGG